MSCGSRTTRFRVTGAMGYPAKDYYLLIASSIAKEDWYWALQAAASHEDHVGARDTPS